MLSYVHQLVSERQMEMYLHATSDTMFSSLPTGGGAVTYLWPLQSHLTQELMAIKNLSTKKQKPGVLVGVGGFLSSVKGDISCQSEV